MPFPPPARPGMRVEDADTPALLLDLDIFEANIAAMAKLVPQGVAIRPHAKTHKSADIVRIQTAAGAVGVCCQKVSEAEALVRAGATDVLLSNQVVVPTKLARLATLGRSARIGLACDAPGPVALAERAAADAGIRLDMVVEIEAGAGRAGVDNDDALLALARMIDDAPSLEFRGIQAYDGRSQHIRDHAARLAAVTATHARARHARDLLEAIGLPCPVVTGFGTGTVGMVDSDIFTEVQPGSYIFMDRDYDALVGPAGGPGTPFQQSLFVLTTVVSAPAPGRSSVDAGHKAVAVDLGMPGIARLPGYVYGRASDEAGIVTWPAGARPLEIGETLMLVPSHCDPTVNLHDWLVCHRHGVVEAVWPVTARGAIY